MNEFKIEKEQKQEMAGKLQAYFLQERGEELSELGAEMLVDFISEKLGAVYYNHGISDAYAHMSGRLEELFELEKY